MRGVEPPTCRLQIGCSAIELHRRRGLSHATTRNEQKRRIYKSAPCVNGVLPQLSHAAGMPWNGSLRHRNRWCKGAAGRLSSPGLFSCAALLPGTGKDDGPATATLSELLPARMGMRTRTSQRSRTSRRMPLLLHPGQWPYVRATAPGPPAGRPAWPCRISRTLLLQLVQGLGKVCHPHHRHLLNDTGGPFGDRRRKGNGTVAGHDNRVHAKRGGRPHE